MQAFENIKSYCEKNPVETPAQMEAYLKFVQQEEKKNKPTVMEILNNEREFYPKGDIEAVLSSAKENADIVEFLIDQEKECAERLQKLREFRILYILICE